MPFYERGHVRIHYEEVGSGFPLRRWRGSSTFLPSRSLHVSCRARGSTELHRRRGTEGSNPPPSSGESANPRSLGI